MVRGDREMGWPLAPPPGFSRLCPLRLELKKQREDIREDRWAEAGVLTCMSLALTYQGPCSLRLSDSLIQAAWPVSRIWSGCADLENTLPNPPQSYGKKPHAIFRFRVKKKKFFSPLVKEAVVILNTAPPHSPYSSQPCICNEFLNLRLLSWDVATLFLSILSHSTI